MSKYDNIARLDEVGDWMSVQRAAEILNLETSMIRHLVSQQILSARRWSGHALMIHRESVTAYAADRRTPGRPPKIQERPHSDTPPPPELPN